MASPRESILIVESDPDISDLIARQALNPLGYRTRILGEAATAIQQALESAPDLIVANLNLPGLSGTDLLAALASQGVTLPVVVVAEKGQEQRVIQAFRLGAVDALFWPARDAEVVRVVERALQQTRAARLRRQLDQQLQAAQQELERKVQDLTTLLSIGKAVISMTDQRQLFGRLLDGALQIAQADAAWFLLRDDTTKAFVLKAYRNLPAAWAKKLNQPLDDGLGSLVALSGQSLAIHGSPLQKFKVAALAKSAGVVPVKAQEEVIGLLIVVRRADREIERNTQALLEAIADFASISLVNFHLFQAVEQAAEAAKVNEQKRKAAFDSLRASIRDEVRVSMHPLEGLISGNSGGLTREQQQALDTIRTSLKRLAVSADRTASGGDHKAS